MSKSRKYIVIVTCSKGREGTSAMMGLLNILGYNAIGKSGVFGEHPMNPKGFFESRQNNKLLDDWFKDYYPGIKNPPTIEQLNEICLKHKDEYVEFLKNEFEGSNKISIKFASYLLIPLFYHLNNEYNIKVINMTRNLEDHVQSYKKVNDVLKNENNFNQESLKLNIQQWKELGNKIFDNYSLDLMNVDFHELIKEREKTIEKITGFLNIAHYDKDKIDEWIDPKLYNRKKYLQRKSIKNRLMNIIKIYRNLIIKKRIKQQIKAFKNIQGYLTYNEAIQLYKIAKMLPKDAKAVEIGSWKGKSTYCIAKGLNKGTIYAIDPFDAAGDSAAKTTYERDKGQKPLKEQFLDNMTRHNLQHKIQPLEGYSKNFVGTIKDIDFLFIDGDHSIEGCKFDYVNYKDDIKVGGIIAFHDYYKDKNELGPTYVIDNLIKEENCFKRLMLIDSLWVGMKIR